MNDQITDTENKAPTVGGNGRSALAQAVLRATGREKEDPKPEASGGASSDDAAPELLNITDPGTQIEGDPEPGEGSVEVWQFNNVEYTAEQVEESLREREMYQRYNQSVQPMISAIEKSDEETAYFKEMALTETDRVIAELKKAIASGHLDSRQELSARKQLDDAKKRQRELTTVAEQATAARAEAIRKVREHNAKQAVAALTKQGWKREEILAVGSLAQRVVGDKFGDVMSPELMQIFRDAAELRAAKESAAKRLKTKTTSVLKTTSQPPKNPAPKTVGKPSFGALVWGDRYK